MGILERRSLALVVPIFLVACTGDTGTISKSTGLEEIVNTTEPAPGPRAAKFIFREDNPGGSFNAAPPGGTAPGFGNGHAATRVFNADGSTLAANGPTDTNWPKWIKRFEIGISGPNNTSATDLSCARFANATDTGSVCDPNRDGTFDVPCGAPSGVYRVSDWDCVNGTVVNGNGGPTDGVYFRFEVSRDPDELALHENLMVSVEYAASYMNAAPPNPSTCFNGGAFTPDDPNCSDTSWNLYLKHTPLQVVQPFVLMIPPSFGKVDPDRNTLGTGVTTRQFHLPIASDNGIKYIVFSRVRGIPRTTLYDNTCKNGAATNANSPFCVGVVVESVTIYRM